MARSPRTKHLPWVGIGLRRSFWMLWGAVCLVALGYVGVAATARMRVATQETFTGVLHPDHEPVVIELPAGVPLLSVLVEPGEVVQSGQTLALVDQAVIVARLDEIKREVLAAEILRACLLSHNSYAAPNLEEMDVDLEAKLMAKAALESCALEWGEQTAFEERITTAQDTLEKRQTLLRKKLELAILSDGTSRDQAQEAIEIALEQNAITKKLEQLAAEFETLRIEKKRSRLTIVQDTSKSVSSLLYQKSILEKFADAPRLTAPQSGTVSRVRPILVGSEYDQPQEIMELRQPEHASYTAEFTMPLARAAQLREGDAVRLRLLGYPEGGPVLGGEISALLDGENDASGNHVIATIALDQVSIERLNDPRGGIALRGRDTASAIHVSAVEAPVLNRLYATMINSFQSAEWQTELWASLH